MTSPELLSTILHFRAGHDAADLGYLGRQVQAWFLREVRRHDIAISDHLHDETVDPKTTKPLLRPYTISTVYKGEFPARDLCAGDWCWIRITSLTLQLSEFLIQTVLPDLMPIAEIDPIALIPQDWKKNQTDLLLTHESSYAQLMHQAARSEEKRITLEFLTPTTFKQKNAHNNGERDMPLPVPVMVFGNYLNHWSAFSGEQTPDEFGEFIEECLVVNELSIRTERVHFSRKNSHDAAVGFTGHVRFAMLGDKRKSRFGDRWEHYANIARMLAAYSFYCGTGRKTTRGLGQTRPLSPLR